MAALERQLAPIATGTTPTDGSRKVGFVSAGVQLQTDGGLKVNANKEDIKLPKESDSEDDERVEIAQKDVPAAVFGGLVKKRVETEKDGVGHNDVAVKDGENRIGALVRIKRQKQA